MQRVENGCASIHTDYWPEAYTDQLMAIHQHGTRREARGTVSFELRPTMVVVGDTSARFVVLPGRGLNHCFAIAEAVSIIAGHNSVDFLQFYNSQIAAFSNDGKRFDGHYGERLLYSRQLEYVIEELQRDPGSRRAMVTIWLPCRDTIVGSKDYPCNVMVMFKIADNKLDCHVVRRSSDIIWGVPYDHVVFTILQDIVAASLKIRSGRMVETTDSLHLYDGAYDEVLGSAIKSAQDGNAYGMMDGTQRCHLQTTRDICRRIIEADARLREVPPCMFQIARDIQCSIPDGWWSDAWMTLAAYHLWKQSQFAAFLRAIGHVSMGFKSVLWSTFETRIATKAGKLGAGFLDEFRASTFVDATTGFWRKGVNT